MYQAITTRFLGPTDTKDSRVKAFAEAGSVILNWDHALNSDENHCRAAMALAAKFKWKGSYYSGGIGGKDIVWVCVEIACAKHLRHFFNGEASQMAT